jgi:hypothetical protein
MPGCMLIAGDAGAGTAAATGAGAAGALARVGAGAADGFAAAVLAAATGMVVDDFCGFLADCPVATQALGGSAFDAAALPGKAARAFGGNGGGVVAGCTPAGAFMADGAGVVGG